MIVALLNIVFLSQPGNSNIKAAVKHSYFTRNQTLNFSIDKW